MPKSDLSKKDLQTLLKEAQKIRKDEGLEKEAALDEAWRRKKK